MKPITVMILVFLIFFGTIFTTRALGSFNVLPELVKTGDTIKLSEVKGYMTIDDAIKATNLTKEEFYKVFSIPSNVTSTTIMKKISEIVPDFSLNKVKEKMEENGQ